MLIQLKCKNCDSNLIPGTDSKTFICEACGTYYIYEAQTHGETTRSIIPTLLEERIKQAQQAAIEHKRQIAEETEQEHRRLAEVEEKAYRIRNRLCRHCGGEFEGWLFKNCKNCGMPKDY